MSTPTIHLAAPHQPRLLRFVRSLTLGDWRLKLYSITLQGRARRPEMLEAAIAVAAAELPQPAHTADRYATGFVIAHDAAIALVYWWQNENELHQRVHFGLRETPAAMRKLPDPGAGCVWKLGIVEFERRCWLQDVLTNPADPDLAAYLSRGIDAEF
jgi:hypothetical protein